MTSSANCAVVLSCHAAGTEGRAVHSCVASTPTVSFTIDQVASTEVARRLAEKGLFASHGDFYAQTVIERLGLAPEGLVRVGCACYTSDEEIERLIEAVSEIAKG